MVHPGFWIRVLAHLVDGILINVAVVICALIMGFAIGFVGALLHMDTGLVVIFAQVIGGTFGLVASWLYYALMESSEMQATLGKKVCGFVVTDMAGNRITFARATGRFFGMIVSSLTLGIGFVMCAFTEKKQCLHDIMAGCLMYKK